MIKKLFIYQCILMLIAQSCISYSTLQTARAIGDEKLSITVAGSSVNSGVQFEENEDFRVPIMEVQGIYGWNDRLDIQAKIGLVGMSGLGFKYQFVGNQTSKIAVASGLHAGKSFKYTVWNNIYVIQFKGETYWKADGKWYILGTCVPNADPSKAKTSFKVCNTPNPDGTCNYECVYLESGTGIGAQAADMIAKGFTKTLELMLTGGTSATWKSGIGDVGLEALAMYAEKTADWSIGTQAAILALNVKLAASGKVTAEQQAEIGKLLSNTGIGDYLKKFPSKAKEVVTDVIKKVQKAGSLDDLVFWASNNGLANLTRTELDEIFKFFDHNFDFAKRIASSTKEIQSAATLSELAGKLNLSVIPAAKSLTPYKARVWYNWRKSKIFDLIDKSQTLENQAKQALNLRNEIRTTTRQAMKDADIAGYLDSKELNMTWAAALNKYGTDYNEIIQASMRGRGWLNDLFKIPDLK